MTDPAASETPSRAETRELIPGRTVGLVLAAGILFGIIAASSDTFLTPYTRFVVSRQVAFFVLIALAQAVCLVVGCLNLSVGAIGSIATVVLGICLDDWGLPIWLAVSAGLAVGLGAGLLNGLLIVKLQINAFIVTLSTMFVFMGLRSGISGGEPYEVPQSFTAVGQGRLLGIPYVFIIMVAVLLAVGCIYRNTVFGRRMLATGGNLEAARLAGVNTNGMIVGANVLSGLFAALTAVLWASELGSAAPETGDAWLIVSFAVAIIGGTSLMGGAISAFGILLGGIVYTLIRHGLIELKANPYYMNVYLGCLILLAIAIDQIREFFARRAGRMHRHG
ncbi:MAG: ABC transporter permease [Armatimonadota bacterium]|jgi:ribose transport system permease protein